MVKILPRPFFSRYGHSCCYFYVSYVFISVKVEHIKLFILFRLYWHKLKTLKYIKNFIMFNIIVLLHGTILPRKTTSCSRDLIKCNEQAFY